MTILKKIFGVLSMLIGILIIAWFIYNQFLPTEAFKASYKSPRQLIFPVLMVSFGWKWLKNSDTKKDTPE
ncbi:MAG: hypothetical protein B6I28_01350 [Fusobacteriia bacterium 4572_132]|nr:MAG: hypothetical protein B6I28_01350 [Fusobacteriia bacterium 4572_132]